MLRDIGLAQARRRIRQHRDELGRDARFSGGGGDLGGVVRVGAVRQQDNGHGKLAGSDSSGFLDFTRSDKVLYRQDERKAASNMPIEIVELTKELIARPSVTPEDAGCLDLIAGLLAPLGFRCERIDANGVSNLWARRGDGSAARVLRRAHRRRAHRPARALAVRSVHADGPRRRRSTGAARPT